MSVFVIEIDKEKLVEEVLCLKDEESWVEFEKKYFDFNNFPILSNNRFKKGMERSSIVVDGITWVPTEEAYSVDGLILSLHGELHDLFMKNYDCVRWEKFISQENMARYCSVCRRYGKGFVQESCPFCGNYVSSLVLRS